MNTASGHESSGSGEEFALWSQQYALNAQGVRQRIVEGIPLAELPTAALDLLRAAQGKQTDRQEAPILVGAIPFDPAQGAHLYIPETYRFQRVMRSQRKATGPAAEGRSDQAVGQRVHVTVAPDALGGREQYEKAVATAVDQIQHQLLQKVVLSRSADYQVSQSVSIAELFARLEADNDTGYTFQVTLPLEQGTLIGATPELLVSLHSDELLSYPLAGSARREDGAARDESASSPAELAGRGLLDSQKNRNEHELVVQHVVSSLTGHATEIVRDEVPHLVGTPQLWHLGTRVTARSLPGLNVLEYALRLHPTPAVGGVPQGPAVAAIKELEQTDRGFYSGIVGWMDVEGRGEWILSLRCGVVNDRKIRAYAGAGIVAQSDPAKEYLETNRKMETFLNALFSE